MSAPSADRERPAPRRRCPICGRPAAEPTRPFCSPACRDRDLGNWLTGAYRIAAPGDPNEPDGPKNEADRD